MLMRGAKVVGWIGVLSVLGGCSADAYVGEDVPQALPGGNGETGGTGGEEGSETCTGVCVARRRWDWEGPVSLWVGQNAEQPTPACPAAGWVERYKGYLEPEPQPLTCPQCACELPPEVCTPGTDWTAHSKVGCTGTATDFSAPAGWDGTCTGENAIPEGQLCDGKPCVQSVLIPPPEISSCVVRVDASNTGEMGKFPSAQSITAQGCGLLKLDEDATCLDAKQCLPPLPQGFMACVHREGDHSCLEADYPNRYLFYSEYVDTRGCTECTCGTPLGAKCSMNLQADIDPVCTVNSCATTIGAAESAKCVDVMEGIALGSKSAKTISAAPGVCEPPTGGEPSGELKMGLPRTFCCQ